MLMFNADELFERLGLTTRCEDCEHRNKDCGDVRCENGTWAQVCDVLDHMKLIDAVPVVLCKDCKWWTKQEKSIQGRCALNGMYPTGGWYCANGRREYDETD